DGPDGLPHPALGALEHPLRAREDRPWTVSRHQCLELAFPDLAGTHHRPEVALALLRCPDIRHEQLKRRLGDDASIDHLDRGTAHPFLVDLRCVPGQASGRHAADVLPVGANTYEECRGAVHEYRANK